MKIDIAELKNGFDKIFNVLLDDGIEEIDVPVDFYWHIDESELYNTDVKPKSLDIGQLSDDYFELQKINASPSDPIPYSLVWLASLARAVGENKVI